MKENLQTTAFHCSMDFSRDITSMASSIGGPVDAPDDEAQTIVRVRITAWKAASDYAAIVSPKTKIGPSPSPGQAVRIPLTEESAVFLFKDLSAIAVPLKHRPSSAVTIPLNREYISSVLLPNLIQSDFPSVTRSEYDIIIMNGTGTILYSSLDTARLAIFQKADLSIPFLAFPPAMPVSMRPMKPDRREYRPESFDGNPRDFEQRHDGPPPQMKREPRDREGGLGNQARENRDRESRH